MGILGQLLSDWSRGAQLRKYQVRFSKIVWPGDTVVAKGRVMERWGDNGRYFAEVDLWAENQKGELVLRGSALVQLFYSLDDENRQRSGQPPLVVPAARESLHAPAPKPPEPRPLPHPHAHPHPAALPKKPAASSRKSAQKKSARK
jgi:hypothetical protein